jgi:hypothetical protein
MICARITYQLKRDRQPRTTTAGLYAGYGDDAEIVHELVLLALTAVEWPTLIAHDGSILRFPRDGIDSVMVWAEPAEADG